MGEGVLLCKRKEKGVLGREDHLEEETLGEVLLVVGTMKPLPAELWVELGEGGVVSKRCKTESRVLKQSFLFY